MTEWVTHGSRLLVYSLILAFVGLCIWGIQSLLLLAVRELADLCAVIRRRPQVRESEWIFRLLGLPFYLLSATILFFLLFIFLGYMIHEGLSPNPR